VEETSVVVGLAKHEGAGNDFLVMIDLEDRVQLTSNEVRFMADRRHGIGADGVIVLTGPSEGGDLTMTLWNQDGSLAEISGNGVRCAAHEAVRSGVVASGSFAIMTGAGLRRVLCADPVGQVAMTSVAMGTPTIEALDPLHGEAFVNVGNPHHVLVVSDLDAIDSQRDGAVLQDLRDGGVNVEWVQVHNDSTVSMKVFERGVGPTLACGSGSVAVVTALRELGLCADTVSVQNPGGSLGVSFEGLEATLSGPVAFVGDVVLPLLRRP